MTCLVCGRVHPFPVVSREFVPVSVPTTPREVVEAACRAAEDATRRMAFPVRPYPVDPRPRPNPEPYRVRLREFAIKVEQLRLDGLDVDG